jgi:preprotein translocase subunit SecA
VDEVDSVLIDDARTPLIISGPVTRGAEDQEYVELNPTVKRLLEEQSKLATQFLAEAKKLIAEGNTWRRRRRRRLALLRAHRALPKARPLIKFLSEEGHESAAAKNRKRLFAGKSKRMPEVDARPCCSSSTKKTARLNFRKRGGIPVQGFNNDPNFFIMPDIAVSLMKLTAIPSLAHEKK